jgi:hypothetical protein
MCRPLPSQQTSRGYGGTGLSPLPNVLEVRATLAAAQNAPLLAMQLGGAASALHAQLHQPLGETAEVMLERRLAPARLVLTVDEQAQAWAEGQRVTSDEIIAAALRNTPPAIASARDGNRQDRGPRLSWQCQLIETQGVGHRGVLVLAWDATVGASTRVRRVQELRLVGGGGTDMRVGIEVAESSRPRPDVIVAMTDGYTPWPEEPTRGRLAAAVIGQDRPPGSPFRRPRSWCPPGNGFTARFRL